MSKQDGSERKKLTMNCGEMSTGMRAEPRVEEMKSRSGSDSRIKSRGKEQQKAEQTESRTNRTMIMSEVSRKPTLDGTDIR
jgi:hypothetical protein